VSESAIELPNLPTPESRPPRSLWGRWLSGGGRLDEGASEERTYRWYWVMWLTGMDYFSSLAYQAGIALLAAGALGPIATLLLVAATIFGALPVYRKVAGYSYAGQGSIAMLENLLPGWSAKIFVLVLLGFAATDFVITMTLSAADAATHAVENPYFHSLLQGHQMSLTLGLLVLLGGVFLMGFQEAIAVSALVGIPFVLLNAIALGAGLVRIAQQPALIAQWKLSLFAHGDWTMIFVASALVFPKLVLGMSGFETGVSVMPLISGSREEGQPDSLPQGRIRATARLLTAAALIMGVLLLISSFVTTLLIPESAYRAGGPADGRAIAYLAHQLLGNVFGTVYDLSTIAILWFAGASAMAGLISLIPRYLPRFGMAPRWVAYRRPMVIVLFVADLLVTLAFKASVEEQAGAFATGVLVLILSASVAAAIALGREARSRSAGATAFFQTGYFWLVSALFTYTLAANIVERPDGVIISSIFIAFILIASAASRYQRARELRVSGMRFLDQRSAALWPEIIKKQVNLVPLHGASHQARAHKAAQIRAHYQVSGPLAFLHVHLLDNRSEFISSLRLGIRHEHDDYVIEIWGAVAVANTIAYFSELMDPKSVFLSLTGHDLMKQSLRYMLFGEGETGLMVYTILVPYWEQLGRQVPHPPLFLTSA
jgi:hypothetical protein